MLPMEYIVLSLRIAALMEMIGRDAIEQMLSHLVQMEEERFVAKLHQTIEK